MLVGALGDTSVLLGSPFTAYNCNDSFLKRRTNGVRRRCVSIIRKDIYAEERERLLYQNMYFLLFSHSWTHTAICDSFPAGARVLPSGKPGTICFYWSNQICYRGMGGSDERMMAAKKKDLSLHLVHNEEEALSLLFKVQKEVVATGATAAILSAIPGVNK